MGKKKRKNYALSYHIDLRWSKINPTSLKIIIRRSKIVYLIKKNIQNSNNFQVNILSLNFTNLDSHFFYMPTKIHFAPKF